MNEVDLNAIVLALVHFETGWENSLRPQCEFEDLEILEIMRLPDEMLKINFKYHFDEDVFSQYDKTHTLDDSATITVSGEILDFVLEEVHTGVAANFTPYQIRPAEGNNY